MNQPPQHEQRISFSLAVMEDLDDFFDTLNHGQVKRIMAKLQADGRPVQIQPPAPIEPAAAPLDPSATTGAAQE